MVRVAAAVEGGPDEAAALRRHRVADPDVVAKLVRGTQALLTPREQDVLRLMAGGHSNAAVAERLAITEKSVSDFINTLFGNLGLEPSTSHHRRVLAVLAYLDRSSAA